MNKSELAKKIHPLADPKKKLGSITFVHTDGTVNTFYSVVNSMTGERLSAYNDTAPTVGDTIREVKETFENIRACALEIKEVIGDF